MLRALPFNILVCVLALTHGSPARAASGGVPVQITQSGYLLDVNDEPLSNPALTLTFRVSDQAGTAGEVVQWQGSCASVPVTGGYYAVTLGGAGCVGSSAGGLDPVLDAADVPAGATRWIEIEIGGVVLAPRLPIGSLPTALVAADAQRLGGVAASVLVDSVSGKLLASALPAGAIGNAQVASNAAIDVSKLAPGANAQVLKTVGGTPTWTTPAALTAGEVTAALGYVPVDPAQNVGIGTTAPAVALDVAGAIRPGSQVAVTTCNGSTEGSLRYNYASHVMEFCNGTTWSGISNAGSPNAFAFTNQSCMATGSTITSNAVTLTGFTGPITATCGSGCTAISRNGAAFSAGPVAGFFSGDSIAIRLVSAATTLTSTTATVTVGSTTSAVWNVSTGAPGGLATFTTVGSTTFTPGTCVSQVQVLVVAGGGGGGGQVGGGGGGGGVIQNPAYAVTPGTPVSVVVGGGGAGGAVEVTFGQQSGASGGNSVFGSLTAIGGGGGGGYNNTVGARTGGSGGGGGGTNTAGAAGTPGQGFAGGNGIVGSWGGGGGGGAGAAAVAATANVGSVGGAGIASTISGATTYYGGGGGGCSNGTVPGAAGGVGGGGTGGSSAGSTEVNRVTSGAPNTGGGGGGARDHDVLGHFNVAGNAGAGAGGSGIVIVKW